MRNTYLNPTLPVVVPAPQAPEPRRPLERATAHEEQTVNGIDVAALQDPAVAHGDAQRAAVGADAPILRAVVAHQSSSEMPRDS